MRRAEDMHWSSEERDGVIIAGPDGRIDEANSDAFAEELAASVTLAAAAPGRRLIVNMAGLDYMSSRGLRALTIAKRQADAAGVTIILAAPNSIMREILAISRYDKLFTIAQTLDTAL